MRIHQVIFMGLIAAALVVGCVKSPGKVIWGLAGGFAGFLIPFLLAQLYVWRGGDPTAAGALSFFTLFTIPIGIAIGVAVVSQISRERAAKGKNSKGEKA